MAENGTAPTSEEKTTLGPSPGLKKRPSHTLRIDRHVRPVVIRFNGKVVAETRKAISLQEADYNPVAYIPIQDVKGEYLTPSDHVTNCPYKGDAQYWNVEVDGRIAKNAVWRYALPYDEVAELRNYVSFYPGKVDVEIAI